MRTLLLFITITLLYTTNVYSKEMLDCKNVKKTSPKYLICKTKAAGSSIRSKLTKKVKLSNRTGEESFIKRFGKAKSLSDLK